MTPKLELSDSENDQFNELYDKLLIQVKSNCKKIGAGIYKNYPSLIQKLTDYYQYDISKQIYIHKNGFFYCENGNIKPFSSFKDALNGKFQYCSRQCLCYKSEVVEKRKATYFSKYGVDNPMKSEDVKNKVKKTNIDRYGVEYQTQQEDFKKKRAVTNIERYGTEHPILNEHVNSQRKQTIMERYGVDHHMHLDQTKEKLKNTCLERYGVYQYSQTPEFMEKFKKTNLERYGVEYPMQNTELVQKLKNNNLEKYGVSCQLMAPLIKEKSDKVKIEKYGTIYPYQNPEFKRTIDDSLFDKYGVKNVQRINYTDYGKQIFDNIEKFAEDLKQSQILEMAEKINCHPAVVYKFCSVNNIELPVIQRQRQEIEISNFLDYHNLRFLCNDRSTIGGKELDFYLPDHDLAIEFNGVYWHGEMMGKTRNYHYEKWKKCEDQNINLLSIWEDDWEVEHKKKLWKNKILYMCNKSDLSRIYARKCDIVQLSYQDTKAFLDQYHLQGFQPFKYSFGLIYDDTIVSVMTFFNTRDNKPDHLELNRFCSINSHNVIGAFQKLLKYAIEVINASTIVSFSDNSYSTGKLYEKSGFTLDSFLPPDYKYVINSQRVHKQNFRKNKLSKIFNLSESDLVNSSEWDIMKNNGIDRIWDCGKKKWILKL